MKNAKAGILFSPSLAEAFVNGGGESVWTQSTVLKKNYTYVSAWACLHFVGSDEHTHTHR